MAEMKKFTIEGDAKFSYEAEEGSRCVTIDDECLPGLIAQKFEFPNEEEWDRMYQYLDGLREQGLRPAEGEPDIVREGMRLRITVEVVE